MPNRMCLSVVGDTSIGRRCRHTSPSPQGVERRRASAIVRGTITRAFLRRGSVRRGEPHINLPQRRHLKLFEVSKLGDRRVAAPYRQRIRRNADDRQLFNSVQNLSRIRIHAARLWYLYVAFVASLNRARRSNHTEEVQMPNDDRAISDLQSKKTVFAGALKHARSAALIASLVPVAQIAVAPATLSAQCPSGGCPPSPVPEPTTLLLLAPGAAMLFLRRRKKK